MKPSANGLRFLEYAYSEWVKAATGETKCNEEQGAILLAEVIHLLVETHNTGASYLDDHLARTYPWGESRKAMAFLVDPKEKFRAFDVFREKHMFSCCRQV